MPLCRWLARAAPQRWAQFTSFGLGGIAIMHMLHSVGRAAGLVDFVTIDTLHLFPETYALVGRTRAQYSLDLKVYRPFNVSTEAEFNASFGADLWLTNPSAYAFVTKVEPMRRALRELNVSVWITGRRRTQGRERRTLEVVELDEGTHTHKINPLCHWTLDELWQYIRSHSLAYNALHDAGYGSVGDRMTTVIGSNASDERGGRWAGSNQTECGMHTHLAKVKQRLPARNTSAGADDTPHLPCEQCVDVDSHTFEQEVVSSVDDVLLELYSPYCSHCQTFAPEYAKVAAALQNVPAIKVARMDAVHFSVPPVLPPSAVRFSVCNVISEGARLHTVEWSVRKGGVAWFVCVVRGAFTQLAAWSQPYLMLEVQQLNTDEGFKLDAYPTIFLATAGAKRTPQRPALRSGLCSLLV